MPFPDETESKMIQLASRAERAEGRVAELGINLQIQESTHLDDLREIESLKDKLREIYRLRGEDPEISRICNRALA